MNREIKFRAWDKRINTWFRHGDGFAISWDATEIIDDNDKTQRITDDIILMQYTGLKDKNGKEIYEGDIIELIIEGESVYLEIRFQNGAFGWIGETTKQFFAFCKDDITDEGTIAGNIYETPNLLNQ